MCCVLYVVRCNVVFYYKIDVHVGMLRKKHQWKIAEFQWLDIFVLAKASGWLSGFPVQCVDGWLKSCLTSWPVGSLTIDSVSAEQSVNESIYCGSVVSYGPIKRSACVFLCVYYWLPLTYVAGFGSVLTEHLQSWRLFFLFHFCCLVPKDMLYWPADRARHSFALSSYLSHTVTCTISWIYVYDQQC